MNCRRIHQLYLKAVLQRVARRRRRCEAAAVRQPTPVVTGANRLWAMDLMQDGVSDGTRFRMFTCVDVATRECLLLAAARRLTAAAVVALLEGAITARGQAPGSLQSDTGTEFTGAVLDPWAWGQGIHSAQAPPRWQKAWIRLERCRRGGVMRRSKFTERHIVEILQAVHGGPPLPEVLRKHGNSRATFLTWKKKYGGATLAELKHLRERESENAKLKRMYAELALENTAIKDILSRRLLNAGTSCVSGSLLELAAKRRLPQRVLPPMNAPAALNRTWALDFMQHMLYDGWRFRTLNVLDEGNRETLAIEMATSLPGPRVTAALDQLVAIHGAPRALRCDNGPELVSQVLTDWCKRQGVRRQHIQPGKPHQNAYIERFNRTYRREVLDAFVLGSLAQVREETEAWVASYTTQRPDDSLGGVPPLTFLPRPAGPSQFSYALSA